MHGKYGSIPRPVLLCTLGFHGDYLLSSVQKVLSKTYIYEAIAKYNLNGVSKIHDK
jgi:hypothetical protein